MKYLTNYEAIILPLAIIASRSGLGKDQMHEWVETTYNLRPQGLLSYHAIQAINGLEELLVELEDEEELDIATKREYGAIQYLINELQEIKNV